MLVAPFRVVLDANVLFPLSLRDTLLRCAAADLYQLHWSEHILDEMERNLTSTGATTPEQARRLRTTMEGAFPEARATDYESLIPTMPNHDKDRHVAAAALKAGAQVIVTSNLKDFQALPEGIEAQSPDEFLCNVFDLDPAAVTEVIQQQAQALRKPPRSFQALLGGLEKTVPAFVSLVRSNE